MGVKEINMARKKKKSIASMIRRPGALSSRAKKNNKTTLQQAQHDKTSGTPLQKRQANFYLNMLRPAAKKKKA